MESVFQSFAADTLAGVMAALFLGLALFNRPNAYERTHCVGQPGYVHMLRLCRLGWWGFSLCALFIILA